MRRQSGLLWVVVLLLALCLYSFFAGRGWRHVYLVHAMSDLSLACKDYERTGQFTNYSSRCTIVQSSRRVVIGGTNYYLCLQADGAEFTNFGSLSITTNGIFIWVGTRGNA